MLKKCFILLGILFIAGCGAKGTFKDEAYIMKANKALIRIRNTIQAYGYDKGGYPPDGADLKKYLRSYYSKEIIHDGDNIPKLSMKVMAAQNEVDQVQGILSELKRRLLFADSAFAAKVNVYLVPSDSILKIYSLELKKGLKKKSSATPIENLKKIDAILGEINPKDKEKSLSDALDTKEAGIDRALQSLKDAINAVDDTLLNVISPILDNIKTTFSGYKKIRKGNIKIRREDLPVPEDEMDAVKTKLKKIKDANVQESIGEIDNLISEYRKLEGQMSFYKYIVVIKGKLPKSINILIQYLKYERESAINANLVLFAQDNLHRIKDIVSAEIHKTGVIPTGDLNEKFNNLPVWVDFTSRFSQGPYVQEIPGGYSIKAKANDFDKTDIILTVNYENGWDKMVKESFSWGPVYTTNDSTITFFVMARAKDASNTMLSTRPQRIQKPEPKKKKRRRRR